jgi:hypothetical protein
MELPLIRDWCSAGLLSRGSNLQVAAGWLHQDLGLKIRSGAY